MLSHGPYYCLCEGSLCPSDNMVYSGSWDDTLRSWDPATGRCVDEFVGHKVGGMSF